MNWYWKARYGFYRVSGIMRRLLGLSWKHTRTLGEIMSELEANPEIRQRLDDARAKLKIPRRHW